MSHVSNSEQKNGRKAGKTRVAVLLFVASYLTVAVVAVGSFLALA